MPTVSSFITFIYLMLIEYLSVDDLMATCSEFAVMIFAGGFAL
jgi:hypothetical protein